MATLPTIDHELLRTFVAIVDQGGFTRAAQTVNRTQSAVSMQMKRLEEDVIERPLFVRQNRQLLLTSEGHTLLGYARKILSLQGEALTLLRQPDMDLIIMTREIGDEIGTILRREPMVWVSAESHSTHLQTPVPLAIFEAPCFCRRHACNALDRAGRTYRIAYSSPSLATLQAVVGAGLAVSAWMRSLVTADMQILGVKEGFPELPEASIVLQRTSSTQSPIIDSLAEHIVEGFRL